MSVRYQKGHLQCRKRKNGWATVMRSLSPEREKASRRGSESVCFKAVRFSTCKYVRRYMSEDGNLRDPKHERILGL